MHYEKILVGTALHKMDPDEVNEQVRLIRRLRGEAFISGRRQKQDREITKGGSKASKAAADLCSQYGLSIDDLKEMAKLAEQEDQTNGNPR